MKATELKIGDWVSYKNEEPVKIAELGLALCSLWDKNEDFHSDISIDYLTPIPLTKEILEKNGWIDDGIHYDLQYKEELYLMFSYTGEKKHRKIDSMEVYTNIGDSIGETDRYYLRDIRYVHELQHLLWALGIDDDLKI